MSVTGRNRFYNFKFNKSIFNYWLILLKHKIST